MHAAGHALVALVAGALAVGLTERISSFSGAPPAAAVHRLPLLVGTEDALVLSLVGLLVVFVKSLTGVYATYVQASAAGELGARLRTELLDALLSVHRLRRPRHDDQGADEASATARGVAALTERVQDVESGLKQGFLGGLRALAQLFPLVVAMAAIAPRTALTACVVLGAFGAALGRVRASYRGALGQAAAERARLLEAADESVRHADLWVSYGAEAKARSMVRSLGSAMALRAARLDARAAALSGANEVLGALALAIAIGAARLGWFGASADGRTLLAFAIAFFLAYRPLRELTEARLALDRAQQAYGELAPTLDRSRSAPEKDAQDRLAGTPERPGGWAMGPLDLRDLKLPRRLCRPLSLRVEPGSIVAIVGPTGIGKTTLLRTLLGLEPLGGGELLYDGVSIGDAPAGPASRPFAWVPQDAPLLADTLDANVNLGGAAASTLAALEVLGPIGARHLGPALDGTRLGAGGRAVSGGERQWIALARAIATGQPILLLDEPTSALDSESQRRVLETIASLRGRRTVILVTHRPEPLAVADAVVRLDAVGPAREAA